MPYTTILIDLDHTIFDSDTSETAAFRHTMLAAGIEDVARYSGAYRAINLELWAAVERHELTPQQVRILRFEQLVATQQLDADPLRMAEDYVLALGANGELYDGALEVLEELSARASLALVTNGLSEVQRTRIRRLGIDELFDAIAISAEIGAAKPGKQIFDSVFAELGQPAKSSAIMVGDNLSADIQGGANYGIATCWYNPHGRVATLSVQPGHEIAALHELLTLVSA
ncbi:MAG: YjjG family noncanonical pyrimidine nucleotidase [Gammaproteobacteria bacterium]|nr:YjjG family noncanonical pyrimidine nucleotidase [Gammaproteobacteria bacterium]MDH5323819.1 YjjG family noncanonical pyrimidine nucleotidase [Gammaproteobacteria bacterium]